MKLRAPKKAPISKTREKSSVQRVNNSVLLRRVEFCCVKGADGLKSPIEAVRTRIPAEPCNRSATEILLKN